MNWGRRVCLHKRVNYRVLKCASCCVQHIKDRLLGRLTAEVSWVEKVELGLCTFLAAHNGN